MQENFKEFKKILEGRNDKKAKKILLEYQQENKKEIIDFIFSEINSDLIQDGLILKYSVHTYFRLKRTSLNDVNPLFDFVTEISNINESLLEVLGYDKMVPPIEEQEKIIKKYFHFGDGIDYRYFSDPRYGLAAACAGWDKEIVRDFLNHCIATGDVPLKYVSENSLKGKYVKLR
ncbi:MAG: hypothetical protein IM571_09475 [Chitinophagaceae bacterium]|jgi:hypothetical protein|nr:hypothetical protein [Bacteroidota bacterium]MCA6462486.1 hypothetical protein [Chitinophagaceae bacterium]MCA6469602.1 hypothetical protein [Chitinophagaceae bacterium]MCA6478169.1 hypothetical protein [Chitinophagaceae bacterium]MCA6480850.1 hypothetical protein [Chitinophagaceae bacterium]